MFYFSFFFFFSYIFIFFISWRLITLQCCSGFCHALTWISHGITCIPHPDPPSYLPLHPIPLGLLLATDGRGDCHQIIFDHPQKKKKGKNWAKDFSILFSLNWKNLFIILLQNWQRQKRKRRLLPDGFNTMSILITLLVLLRQNANFASFTLRFKSSMTEPTTLICNLNVY